MCIVCTEYIKNTLKREEAINGVRELLIDNNDIHKKEVLFLLENSELEKEDIEILLKRLNNEP